MSLRCPICGLDNLKPIEEFNGRLDELEEVCTSADYLHMVKGDGDLHYLFLSAPMTGSVIDLDHAFHAISQLGDEHFKKRKAGQTWFQKFFNSPVVGIMKFLLFALILQLTWIGAVFLIKDTGDWMDSIFQLDNNFFVGLLAIAALTSFSFIAFKKSWESLNSLWTFKSIVNIIVFMIWVLILPMGLSLLFYDVPLLREEPEFAKACAYCLILFLPMSITLIKGHDWLFGSSIGIDYRGNLIVGFVLTAVFGCLDFFEANDGLLFGWFYLCWFFLVFRAVTVPKV